MQYTDGGEATPVRNPLSPPIVGSGEEIQTGQLV